RDFAEHVRCAMPSVTSPSRPLRILDAGGGQGQFSLRLARAGHRLVICDISAEMLNLAQTEVSKNGLDGTVTLVNCALQELPRHLENCQFDLVLCHAVMEWMAEPQTLLLYL